MNSCDMTNRHCTPCEGGIPALDAADAAKLLENLSGWAVVDQCLEKTFAFRNHLETMAFVNAIAWVSHREDHHPELTVGYKDVRVRYWTHAISGLSDNDFICAAKLDQLLAL